MNFGQEEVNKLVCGKKGLSDEETFEQKVERSEGVRHPEPRRVSVGGAGKNKRADPEIALGVVCPHTAKRPG